MSESNNTKKNSRQGATARLVKELSAMFLERESNRTSLITITSVAVSPDIKRATVFITVLPREREKIALGFAMRQRKELREFIKKNMRTKIVPYIEIAIDEGEKNRQKIDELLREK